MATTSTDPFASMYEADDRDQAIFGDAYIGPKEFDYGDWHLVAKYPKEEGGDGQDVEVYESRMPARFFKVVAKASPNSIGKMAEGFSLSTGSGDEMGKWAVETAKKISDGMIGLVTTN